MSMQSSVSLTEAAEQGKLKEYLNQYLESCRTDDSTAPQQQCFPNLAGFCFWMGCGIRALEALGEDYPDEVDHIKTVMEAEAFNAAFRCPAIIQLYLKKRLGYGTEKKASSRSRRQKIICVYEPEEPEAHKKEPPVQDQPPEQAGSEAAPQPKDPRPAPRKSRPRRTHRRRKSAQKRPTGSQSQPHQAPPRPPP